MRWSSQDLAYTKKRPGVMAAAVASSLHVRWPAAMMAVASLLLVATPSVPADAVCREHFAGNTLNWIIPNDVGGGFDAYSRLIGPVYARALGLDVRFHNVTGAGGRIGAERLRRAEPNGLTVGILNGPGLLVAAMTKAAATPNPATDFIILGRVARSSHVWVAAAGSTIREAGSLFDGEREQPVVLGVRDLGSIGFVSLTVSAHLLGIEPEYVAGYKGTRDVVLAILRGEVDIASKSFESLRKAIEQEDLRPLIQIASRPVSTHPALSGIPMLGGEQGLAVRRALALGRDPAAARRDADALGALIGAGRLIAAPPGIPTELTRCMQAALAGALNDPGLRASAAKISRTLEPAAADTALAELKAAAVGADRFLPLIRQAADRLRRGPGGG